MATKVKLIADGVITPDQITLTTASTGTNTTAPATTAFVQQEISALVDSSPEALNTLNELAAALGDDANFSTTVTNSIALKAPLSSPTFTGTLTASGLVYPTSDGINGQVLTTDGAGNLSFSSVSGTTINNNADNRVITGSGTANTLNGESNFVFDGTNVGIGTTSPSATLDVTSAASDAVFLRSSNATTSNVYITNTNATTGNTANLYFAPANNVAGSQISSIAIEDFSSSANRTADLAFSTRLNGTMSERMRIDSVGEVSIKRAGSGGTGVLKALNLNHAGTSVNDGAKISFTAGTSTEGAGIASTGQAYNSADLRFYAGGNTERMRINASGCVGVGSTVDRSLGTNIGTLVVNGSAGGGLWLSPGDSSAMTSKIYAQSNGSVGELIINNGTGVGSGGLIFQTNSTEAMRIDGSRSLFINTTSGYGTPGYSNMWIQHSTGRQRGIAFKATSTSSTDTPLQFFNGGAGIAGQITYTYSATTYSTSSDYRLKENVVYDWDATTRLKQLRPCRFNWIADETNTPIDGFIAHEAAEVVPNSVVGEKDATKDAFLDADGNEIPGSTIDAQTMDHAKLVPLLVKTIQELEQRITTLEG